MNVEDFFCYVFSVFDLAELSSPAYAEGIVFEYITNTLYKNTKTKMRTYFID